MNKYAYCLQEYFCSSCHLLNRHLGQLTVCWLFVSLSTYPTVTLLKAKRDQAFLLLIHIEHWKLSKQYAPAKLDFLIMRIKIRWFGAKLKPIQTLSYFKCMLERGFVDWGSHLDCNISRWKPQMASLMCKKNTTMCSYYLVNSTQDILWDLIIQSFCPKPQFATRCKPVRHTSFSSPSVHCYVQLDTCCDFRPLKRLKRTVTRCTKKELWPFTPVDQQ